MPREFIPERPRLAFIYVVPPHPLPSNAPISLDPDFWGYSNPTKLIQTQKDDSDTLRPAATETWYHQRHLAKRTRLSITEQDSLRRPVPGFFHAGVSFDASSTKVVGPELEGE
ncbi:hypothetical protein EG328_004430 [Venturia inaequalis]|uniref:Uncharacterized protein n=1 Tax=Venturia inaequalis TaxID=5025 RepID=A0A8H3YTZ0_VENIN|nr:hypothetical protein EG328_004430 [Venturia inaequalis]